MAGRKTRQARDSNVACLAFGYALTDLTDLVHQVQNPLDISLEKAHLLRRNESTTSAIKERETQSLPKICK